MTGRAGWGDVLPGRQRLVQVPPDSGLFPVLWVTPALHASDTGRGGPLFLLPDQLNDLHSKGTWTY